MPYHVLLSSGFLGMRRADRFNLRPQELVSDFIEPWLGGKTIVIDGRQWAPAQTRISVYEGQPITSGQRAFGQGALNVTKFSERVTDEVLTPEFCASVAAGTKASAPALDPALFPELRYTQRVRAWNTGGASATFLTGLFFAAVGAFISDKTAAGSVLLGLWFVGATLVPIPLGLTRRQLRYRWRWYVGSFVSGIGLALVMTINLAAGLLALLVMVLALSVGTEIGRYEAHAEGAEPPPERQSSSK